MFTILQPQGISLRSLALPTHLSQEIVHLLFPLPGQQDLRMPGLQVIAHLSLVISLGKPSMPVSKASLPSYSPSGSVLFIPLLGIGKLCSFLSCSFSHPLPTGDLFSPVHNRISSFNRTELRNNRLKWEKKQTNESLYKIWSSHDINSIGCCILSTLHFKRLGSSVMSSYRPLALWRIPQYISLFPPAAPIAQES